MDCPRRMMSGTDLHLHQVMWLIHRRMVNFSPFYSSLSVSIWKVYFYPARKIEKKEGVFLYLATKRENGLGVTKIKVGRYSYTSSWAIHCKSRSFWPTKWNLSAWLPWQTYISFEWKKYISSNVQDWFMHQLWSWGLWVWWSLEVW